MKNVAHFFLTWPLILAFYSCGTTVSGNNTSPKTELEKLVYHSSRCFGTCPQIDLQIDSKRNIIVNRWYSKALGEEDSTASGKFKGVLSREVYDQLLQVLRSSDYEHLKFPKVFCCDGVITTIIIYSAGKKTYLKSMTPPAAADQLITFLHQLGTDTKLTRTDEEFNMEE